MFEADVVERDPDTRAGVVGPQRAGLRVVRPSNQPTGLFAVVEMTVLVVVTALAMVSVIVSSAGDDASGHGQPAAASSHHAGFGNAIARRVETPSRDDEAPR